MQRSKKALNHWELETIVFLINNVIFTCLVYSQNMRWVLIK